GPIAISRSATTSRTTTPDKSRTKTDRFNPRLAKPKKKRVRAEFRKNRTSRARRSGWTRDLQTDSGDQENAARDERISGKGELTRKRTVRGATDDSEQGFGVRLDVDESVCLPGRVLAVHGLTSVVEAANG